MSKKEKVVKNNEEKVYEIGYHVISSVAEEGIPAEVEKVKAILNKEKAEIISEEIPKLRPLAYSIKKAFGGQYKTFDKAYFGWIKFNLPLSGDITKIESALKGSDTLLRYLVIKTIRGNTMYSPKITVFSDKEAKIKPMAVKEAKEAKPASIEEIDKSIDELVSEEVKV
ncbi:MAG: 30S ribosomal protein S6 [Candidatus Paceibacterota bacterium]|jgi:ribosomal protein S6